MISVFGFSKTRVLFQLSLKFVLIECLHPHSEYVDNSKPTFELVKKINVLDGRVALREHVI